MAEGRLKERIIHTCITICLIFAFLCRSTCGCIEPFFSECICEVQQLFQEKGRLVSCTNVETLEHYFPISEYPLGTISLELTGCKITNVSKLIPRHQSSVNKVLQLILSHNQIKYIQAGTFQHFKNLKLLNLSHNNIAVITTEMFDGLPDLHTLYLDHNSFSYVPGTAFVNLPALKKLDLTSGCMICNCLMHNFILWYQKKKKKIELIGECALPIKQQMLERLKPEDLKTCDILEKLPYFELYPSKKQVVFEGDSLPLFCEGTNLPSSKITWRHNNVKLAVDHGGLSSTSLYQPKISAYHHLFKINNSYSGIWSCTISSNYSVVSDRVDMLVLNQNAQYCPKEVATNDMGHFIWPETVSGITTFLTCDQPMSTEASRSCLNVGKWNEADYTQCQLADDFARHIKNFFMKNVTQRNAVKECNQVTQLLSNIKLEATIGLKYLEELMLICLTKFPPSKNKELGKILVELLSKASTSGFEIIKDRGSAEYFKLMHKTFLTMMQQQLSDKSLFVETSSNMAVFGKNLNSTEQLMVCLPSFKKSSQMQVKCNFSGNIKNVKEDLFIEISLPSINEKHQKIFVLNYRNGNTFQSQHAKTITLQYYEKWFTEKNKSDANSNYKPDPSASKVVTDNQYEEHVIISNVYAITINNQTKGNLSQPAKYVFSTTERVPAIKALYGYYIALWDGERWLPTRGFCHFNQTGVLQNDHENHTVVLCRVFGTIAVMKNVYHGNVVSSKNDSYHPMLHPIAMVGSGCLAISLLTVIFTYLKFSSQIKISRDARHMLLNKCVHFLIAIVFFVVGVWRVNSEFFCYTTGILLHYSSMSILLWITISSRNICKEMLIIQNPPSLEPKPSRPMLRFYLIGCGIPIIICGITAAAKLQNYDGDGGKYCWLSWETSLYAFYGPSALIASYCIIVLLRVLATLNCTHNLKWKSKRQKNHAAEAINLRSTSYGTNGDADSDVSPTVKDIENEQSYRSRLRGVSLTLVCFIATWTAAAMSVAAPHIQEFTNTAQYSSLNNPPTNELGLYMNVEPKPDPPSIDLRVIFSCIFAVFAIFTAGFLFVQQLITRKDVCQAWKRLYTKPCAKNKHFHGSADCCKRKTDLKTTNERRQDTATTAVTDPITIETVLNTDSLCDDPTPIHQTCTSHHSSNVPRSSINSTNRRCGSSYIMYSSGTHNKFQRSDTKNSFDGKSVSVLDSQHGINVVDQDCNFQHHYCQESYVKNRTKPIKLTNLQHQYDSLTEHSFEESHNMHTIPVILQPPKKLDNGALYNRYQRMRKALEAKKHKPPRLTVLREHAQDSLTSDEEKSKYKMFNTNELTSLLTSNTTEKPCVPSLDKEYCESLSNCSHSVEPSLIVPQTTKNDQNRVDGEENLNLITNYNQSLKKSKWETAAFTEPGEASMHRISNGSSAVNLTSQESTVYCTSSGHRRHFYLTASDVLGNLHVPPKLEREQTDNTGFNEFDPLFGCSNSNKDDELSLASSSQPFYADDCAYASLRNETSV